MYLFAGRLISIIAGSITLFGIYKLSFFLFKSQKISVFSVFLSIISPFMLFYDRLALYDSLLCAMLIWSVYFALKTSTSFAIRDTLLWGVFLGLGFLTKSPAVFYLVLTVICFFILNHANEKKKDIKKIILLPLVAIIITELINNIQRLSENFKLIDIKNQQFQLSLNEFFSSSFILLINNLKEIFTWLISYYTLPIFILGCFALLILLFKETKKGLILFLLWFSPIFIFAAFGKILFPRYILFTTPYFLIALVVICVNFFSSSKLPKIFKILILFMLLILPLRFDYLIINYPAQAPLANIEHNQYISGKPSGYGLNKIFTFLDKELDNGPPITLVTQGKFGLFPYAFMLRYWDDKRITVVRSWFTKNPDVNIYAFQKSTKVYVVLWENESIPKDFPLTLVMQAQKPGGENSILLAIPK